MQNKFKNSSLILDENDLELLNGINAYQILVKHKCQKILNKAKADADSIRKKAADESEQIIASANAVLETKLSELSAILNKESYDLLEQQLNYLEEHIYSFCYKILTKLHVERDNTQVHKLIKEELLTFTQEPKVNITANAHNITALKNDPRFSNLNITFIENSAFEDHKCVISSNTVTIYVDIDKCYDYILENLEHPFAATQQV